MAAAAAGAYKLSYFPTPGWAEPIRFLLSYAGIDFIDERITHEQWPQVKPTMPFGQMPVLEFDGKKCGQSLAIARYVAKKAKLTGKNDWEDLEIDAIIDTIRDFLKNQNWRAYMGEKDEAKKEELKTKLLEQIPFYFHKFNEIVKQNNGFLAVGRLTWADLYFASKMPEVDPLGRSVSEYLGEYPELGKLRKRVFEIPAIKKWVETRPKADY